MGQRSLGGQRDAQPSPWEGAVPPGSRRGGGSWETTARLDQRSFRSRVRVQEGEGGGREAEPQKRSEPQPSCRHRPGRCVPVPHRQFHGAGCSGSHSPRDARCRRPNPTGGGKAPGSRSHGQASCFISSSSHFQRLANSSGRAARPLRAFGKDAAEMPRCSFSHQETHPHPAEMRAGKSGRNRSFRCQARGPRLCHVSCHRPACHRDASPLRPRLLCVPSPPRSRIRAVTLPSDEILYGSRCCPRASCQRALGCGQRLAEPRRAAELPPTALSFHFFLF